MSGAWRNYVISYNYTRSFEGKEYLDLLTALTSLGAWEFDDPLCSTHFVQSLSSAEELTSN